MLKLDIKKPRKFISPLLSKHSIEKTKFEHFKSEFSKLKRMNQSESEEHQKNLVKDFLVHSFGYTVNTKDRIDLAIFENHNVEVIIEAKRLGNTVEMITQGDIHKKAFAEAVKYFMDERQAGNFSIKHIIILTAFEWFIFDAQDFEKLFWQDKQFKKIYTDYTSSNSLLSKTGDVYDEFIKLFKSMNSKVNLFEDAVISCAYLSFKETYSEKQLIAIYKLLSPDSLQKKFNPNDANTLNRAFYSELLYILGLEERSNKGKKLISRAKAEHRGALYENITQKLIQYGKPTDFESVIRLMIIWINRILFLKLLESQLIKWNNSKEYAFLYAGKIKDFDQLEMLFFDILAKKPHERGHKEFDYIPYLNSSLFEPHAFEQKLLTIATLQDDCDMPYYSKTVLKNAHSKRKEGSVNMLHYLFEFLDAYDFSSEGSEELVTESKSLINASVLGLIFEKLNGYKDGSFYTPSFITMYMSKETITKAVMEKFNHAKGWSCKSLNELDDKIEDKKEANAIIDSLTLCDPAVGSGHFLVSSLNTILEIKSQLRILFDAEGRRIKDYELSVENDELIVRDDEGEIFEYKRGSKEGTRIQKMLFLEKQKIIENSLFGVDINPNSAQITRLRLWIELLKNSYYDKTNHLVTMPNIDINIKVGNSLISRYGLDDEIDIPNIKHAIERYKASVKEYKEGNFLSSKEELRAAIDEVKGMFGLTLKAQWKQTEEYKKNLGKYVKEFGMDGLTRDMQLDALEYNFGYHGNLFDEELSAKQKKEKAKLFQKVTKAAKEIEEIEKGKIYKDAFEWRFEFPEVLDEEGNFVGFDVVIGNPPYFNIDTFGAGSPMLIYFPEHYPEIYMDKSDILFYFIKLATDISKNQTAFIISNAMLFSDKAKKLRNYILKHNPIEKIINFEQYQVFDEASIVSMMIFFNKAYSEKTKVLNFKNKEYKREYIIEKTTQKENYFNASFCENSPLALVNENTERINLKIDADHLKLGELFHVGSGMQTAANKVFTFKDYEIVDFDAEYFKCKMSGDIIEKYVHKSAKEFLLYLEDVKKFDDLPKKIQEYLLENKDRLSDRAEIKRNKNREWWKYTFPMHREYYHLPKIWTSYRSKENTFCLDMSNEYIGLTNTTVIFGTNEDFSLKYILALLNSKLLNFRYKSIGKQTGSGIFEYFENQISKLPIPNIEKKDQKPFVKLVDQIIKLKKHNQDTGELEAQIDQMVYDLYGLNEDEIAIVEGREISK